MAPASTVLRYVSIGATIIMLILTCVAQFTAYWVELEVTQLNLHLHRGLLQWVCIHQDTLSDRHCIAKYPVFPGWLKSVFICICCSIGLQIILLLAEILSAFIQKQKVTITCICTGISLISFILLCVAIGIFTGKTNNYYFEQYAYKGYTVWCQLGWSYWLAIMSIVVGILIVILETIQIFFLSKFSRMKSYPPEAMTTWKFTM